VGRKKKEVNLDEITNEDLISSKHYVNNNELREEIIKCIENDKLSDKAVLMFQQIAERLSRKLKYTNPDDRDDCVGQAICDCISYWRNYNPEKSLNAFSYFTQICVNGFQKGWRKLGKLNLPDSKRVSLSDNIFSI